MSDIYIQMMFALAGVIGLILAGGHLLKKKQTKQGIITIVSYQPFGPKKGIAVLKVGREVLLVGITPTEFTLLKSLREDELEADAAGDIAEKIGALRTMKEKINEH